MTEKDFANFFFIFGVAFGIADHYQTAAENQKCINDFGAKERANYKLSFAYLDTMIGRKYDEFAPAQRLIDKTIKCITHDENTIIDPLAGYRIGIALMQKIALIMKPYRAKNSDRKFWVLVEKAYNEIASYVTEYDEELAIDIIRILEKELKE